MISDKTNILCQKVLAWLGPIYAAGFIVFWAGFGHNLPPPSAGYSVQELMANYYVPYKQQILFGMVITCIFGMLYAVWSIQLGLMMWQRERVPALALCQIAGGVITGWLLTEVPALWATAAYLTGEINPEIIMSIHRTAWMVWLQTYWITVIQVLPLGVFTLIDHGQPRLFPKWCGWIAIISAADLCLLTIVPWFRRGPFSIGGLINFWFVYSTWILFFVCYTIPMIQNLNRLKVATGPAEVRTQSGCSVG
ncbi:MAG: hypothetical protein HY900_31635 [Deltaproteobacteria bacterium]|nr:hypothetical protein [Deltaproteobacteria bacterium]